MKLFSEGSHYEDRTQQRSKISQQIQNLNRPQQSLVLTMTSRQIPAAAGLIQCLWRCYAADKSFHSKVRSKLNGSRYL